MPWKGANWLLKQHSPSASHSPVSKPLHSGKAGQGARRCSSFRFSIFFFSWDHFLFSPEGGIRARLRSLGGCTLRHHHPQRRSSGQSVACWAVRRKHHQEKSAFFFFLSPDSRWQLCKAAQSWRQLVQVPILWDLESETSPPRKRGKQPRIEVWLCGPGRRVAIPAKTSLTTKLGEPPGRGSFREQ